MNLRDAPEYAIPADIDDRLRNWAKWAKVRSWQSCCGSVEKNYQPPAGNTLREEITVFQRADLWDAWEIERVWRMCLPNKEKAVLKATYISRQGYSVQDARRIERLLASKLGVHVSAIPALRFRAALMVRNRAKPQHLVKGA